MASQDRLKQSTGITYSGGVLISLVVKFIGEKRASILPIFALATPVVFGSAALAVDYSYARLIKSRIQDAVDAAVTNGAHELTLTAASKANAISAADSFITTNLSDLAGLKTQTTVGGQKQNELNIDVSYQWQPFLMHIFNPDFETISVTARAKVLFQDKICVLGLSSRRAAIHLDDKSKLQANKCGIYSNSPSPASIRADKRAHARASSFCAVGGFRAHKKSRIIPSPQTDCPIIPDPLAGRAKPTVGACSHTNLVVKNTVTLPPGVYCGGIRIEGNAKVLFQNGAYVIKDGLLEVLDNATMVAKHAGFFLTGRDSTFYFGPDTTIDMTAPKSGRLAGLLFYEDHNVPYSFKIRLKDFPNRNKRVRLQNSNASSDVRLHQISSNNARRFIGTIYLSRSVLLIDSQSAVADRSSYTALVMGRLWLKNGPKLVLNSDYSVTEVPVPAGVGQSHVRLIE